MRGRRASLQVTIEGRDVTADIAPFVLDCAYNDNEAGKVDDISLTLDNRDGRWTDAWWLSKGDQVAVKILCLDWEGEGDNPSLDCGVFTIDQPEASFGNFDTVSIKGVAAPLNKPLRRSPKSKAWEGAGLRTIAQDIATAAGRKLVWEMDANPVISRVEQQQESDLALLSRVALKYGGRVKLHNDQIIVYSSEKYEKAGPVLTLTRGESAILNARFTYQAGGAAKKASTNFFDIIAGMPIVGSATDSDIASDPASYNPEDLQSTNTTAEIVNPAVVSSGDPYSYMDVEQELVSIEPVTSVAEAQSLAGNKLRSNNRKGWKCSMSLMGMPGIATALNMSLAGFGKYSGKWNVEKCSHKVTGNDYTTSAEFYRARL